MAMMMLEHVLADGRFPGGGFAHSGGLEAAVGDGAVTSLGDVAAFVLGRLLTNGATEAWLAARAAEAGFGASERLSALEWEADAHQPSPALRAAARTQGRGLRRSAAVIWPQLGALAAEVHPVVLGSVASVAGMSADAAARLAVHGLIMTVVAAAPKLLPIDMADAMAVAVALAPRAAEVAAGAVAAPLCPIRSSPLVELRSLDHAHREARLFAS